MNPDPLRNTCAAPEEALEDDEEDDGGGSPEVVVVEEDEESEPMATEPVDDFVARVQAAARKQRGHQPPPPDVFGTAVANDRSQPLSALRLQYCLRYLENEVGPYLNKKVIKHAEDPEQQGKLERMLSKHEQSQKLMKVTHDELERMEPTARKAAIQRQWEVFEQVTQFARARKAQEADRKREEAARKALEASKPIPPMTAYMLFANATQATIRAENPQMANGDIQKMLGARWKAIAEEDKAHWQRMAIADKERYQRELAEHKTPPSDAAAPPPEADAAPPPDADSRPEQEEELVAEAEGYQLQLNTTNGSTTGAATPGPPPSHILLTRTLPPASQAISVSTSSDDPRPQGRRPDLSRQSTRASTSASSPRRSRRRWRSRKPVLSRSRSRRVPSIFARLCNSLRSWGPPSSRRRRLRRRRRSSQ